MVANFKDFREIIDCWVDLAIKRAQLGPLCLSRTTKRVRPGAQKPPQKSDAPALGLDPVWSAGRGGCLLLVAYDRPAFRELVARRSADRLARSRHGVPRESAKQAWWF